MKREGDLWDALTGWGNWLTAAAKARRGKRSRQVVQRFEFDRESELLKLRREVFDGSYRPGRFTTHKVYRPKERLISAAPYRDRVVHHAIMTVLQPVLDRRFYPHSYACRPGKGTHSASRYLQRLLRRNRFSVQFDVRKFFPSIDHGILKDRFRRVLKDRRFVRLLDAVIDASNLQEPVIEYFPGDDLFTPLDRRKGLPIGNLTSQWFANWYLDPLDHWLTSSVRVGGLVRYCDDFILCDNDRGKLCELVHAVSAFLDTLRLKVHCERVVVLPARTGRVFVGYRTFPSHRLITAGNKRRFLRRLRWMRTALNQGRVSRETVHQRLMSWLGHAGQADSLPLLRKLAEDWVFVGGKFDHFR